MTKAEKSALGRALAGLRKTHGGPPPKCHANKPDPNCPRCQVRLRLRAWRKAKQGEQAYA